MKMKLRFLGTGGYHPNERRHTAGILVPELGVLFDAGSCLFRVARYLQSPVLDLFLTHAHLDHVMGLTFLLVPILKREITVCRLHAESHVLDAVRNHLFSQPLFPIFPPFELVPLNDETVIADGRAVVTHCPLTHPGGSRGFRVDFNGRSFAYTTDTVADRSYLDFIRDVDVLIHECNFPDEMSQWCDSTGHSHTSAVAQAARDANVGRLYLTHIDPQRPDDDPIGLSTATAIFPKTFLAEDLLEVDV